MHLAKDYYAVARGAVAHIRAASMEDAAQSMINELGMSRPIMMRGRARGRIQFISFSDGIQQFQLWQPEDWARYSDTLPSRRAAERRPVKINRYSVS